MPRPPQSVQFLQRVLHQYPRGEINQDPVEEVTIAGNLRDMLLDIAMIGSDTLIRGTKETGSILIGSMTVGGK
jgi:PmbA protein